MAADVDMECRVFRGKTNPDGRLTDIDEYRQDGTTPDVFTDNAKLSEYSYTLRDDGKRTATDEIIYDSDGSTVLSHTQFDWTYDDAGRLTDEVFTDVGDLLDADNYHTSFEYDLTGNRLKKSTMTDDDGTPGFDATTDTDEVITYGQDANDRMISESRVADGVATDTTTYGYTGTQQTSKTVTPAGSAFSSFSVVYSCDLQGRMSEVVSTTSDPTTGSATRIETTSYRYGTDGIRISAIQQTDSDADGTVDTYEKTEYLIDARNHTGYQQVLEETVTDENGTELRKIVYTIGHDQVSQTTFTPGGPAQGETLVFHYDGHGSTRVLTDLAGAIATIGAPQIYHYTAYGNAINFQMATAATQYLYSGEQFDSRIGQQYLRARYYNQATGTFNRLDPFFGNSTAPQGFHKYLYTHGNPVNGWDPTGYSLSTTVLASAAIGGVAGGLVGGAVAGIPGAIAGTIGGALAGMTFGLAVTGEITAVAASLFAKAGVGAVFATLLAIAGLRHRGGGGLKTNPILPAGPPGVGKVPKRTVAIVVGPGVFSESSNPDLGFPCQAHRFGFHPVI